jgi:hypothetical protein
MSPKLNPCRKSKQRRDKEYIAMRHGEPLPPTFCEKVATLWLKHWGVICLIIVGVLTIITMLFTHFHSNTESDQTQIEQTKD